MTFKVSSRVVLGLAALAAGVLISDWALAQAAAPAAADAAAPAAAAAAPAPITFNKGDNAWMLTSTVLVLLMTIPGLALFYGGLVRAKNMLSVLMHVFYTVCIVSLIWVLYGYSLAFTGGSTPYLGGLSKAFLIGVNADSQAGTFSAGVTIHEYIYICFQMTFAAITPALIVGAFAERMKFSAVVLFVPLWVTIVYFPIAHMVWYWGRPRRDRRGGSRTRQGRSRSGQGSRSSQARRRAGRRRSGVPVGRDRLRRRHRGAHQRRHRRSGGRHHGRQAHWPRQRVHGPALDDPLHGRRLSAVGWLVRLQRRIEPRSQRRRGSRHDQLLRRHRGRCFGLDVRRMDGQG